MPRENPAPTRVLQVVLSLNPGGTERLVVELVRRLHPGVAMAVCCLDEPGAWARELTALGVEVTAIGRRPGFHPAVGREIAALAGRHRADVLHCHHYSPFVYGCVARAWRPRTRVVFTEHGRLSDAQPSGKRRLANRLLARVPRAVFAVSQDLRRHLIAEGFPAAAVRTIYNGIDIGPPVDPEKRAAARAALGVTPGTFVVGTIARLDRVKDLETLIAGSGSLPAVVPALLLIVGEGPERERLEAAARHAPGHVAIRFLGHQDEARRWLAACDAYANTSISEGVSLTILEAMAAGLPVVATAVGGTPEVVDDTCGRLVPARSPQAVAGALSDLVSDAERRHQLGARARQRVCERFSIERMVGAYRDVYEQV